MKTEQKLREGNAVAMIKHKQENCIGWNPDISPLDFENGTLLYTKTQQTPLVRLTDEEINTVITEQLSKTTEPLYLLAFGFANGIMDAMIKKNGGL